MRGSGTNGPNTATTLPGRPPPARPAHARRARPAPPLPRVALETIAAVRAAVTAPSPSRPAAVGQARRAPAGPHHAARPPAGGGGGGGGGPRRPLHLLQPAPRLARPPEVPSGAGRRRAVSAGVRRAAPASPAARASRTGSAAHSCPQRLPPHPRSLAALPGGGGVPAALPAGPSSRSLGATCTLLAFRSSSGLFGVLAYRLQLCNRNSLCLMWQRKGARSLRQPHV